MMQSDQQANSRQNCEQAQRDLVGSVPVLVHYLCERNWQRAEREIRAQAPTAISPALSAAPPEPPAATDPEKQAISETNI